MQGASPDSAISKFRIAEDRGANVTGGAEAFR
jgi:hypothetical protein